MLRASFVAAVLGLTASVPTALPGPSPQTHEITTLWAPFELSFNGPSSHEADTSPNPFLDYRLNVTFRAPSGKEFRVPGFYDGNVQGSGSGKVWKARFSPDEVGTWTWEASFHSGDNIAIVLDPGAGTPTSFDGQTGGFRVVGPPPLAEGFLAKGRLQYVGEHYLRFQDGTYFLKTGTDSPENFLGYSGFDDVEDKGGFPAGIIHDYQPHVGDWKPGDPEVGAAGSPNGLKGIVGSLNYLSEIGVNAVYFLPMNMGGDGWDTVPFLGYAKTSFDKTHYDCSRLTQWNTVFEHAIRKGIQLQFVLSETESENEEWLDAGYLGVERKLFFRELVARFGHHLAIKWNLGEESDFPVWQLEEMADYLDALDVYDHPIGVHTRPDDFSDYYAIQGDPRFSITSIQYQAYKAGEYVEDWRANSAAAGVPWVLDMDENGTPEDGVSDANADEMRKEVLYDVLFSGGNIEWYLGFKSLPLGGDHSVEDFRTREEMWRYSRYARELLEKYFEFWEMEPADYLLTGDNPYLGGGEVFAKIGREYAIYMPAASWPSDLNLNGHADGLFEFRWFNPRTGVFEGEPSYEFGGNKVALGTPPSSPDEDWVVTVQRVEFYSDVVAISLSNPKPQNLFLDVGPDHAGEKYLILSSMSGTIPGTDVFGITLPLNWDGWTTWTATHPVSALTTNFYGAFDAQGKAFAQVDLTPILVPAFAGLTTHHAFVSGHGLFPSWASLPVPMMFVP
ncbi:MAG: DUF5060 domain-containing protein [Planctomycetota bacterium]